MTYFRHAPLAFWSAVLVCLAGLTIVGFLASSGTSPVASGVHAPSTAPNADIELLATTLPSLYPSMNAGTGASWAKDFAALATEGGTRHAESGEYPELDRPWIDVMTAANELTLVDPDDAKRFVAQAGILGAAVGRLSQAARTLR